MIETLTFARTYRYDIRKSGITLPATLTSGDKSIECEAKLDSGSSLCVFPRRYGEELDFDIESGLHRRISTATGGLDAYGHWATIQALGFEYEAMVFFAKDHGYNRNILGHHGWIDRLRLGLIAYDGKLYFSDYNDPLE